MEPSELVLLHLASHTHIRRGKHRVADADLVTTRLVGGGWSWDCDCGERGAWNNTREEATEYARLHRLYKHGVK